MKEFESEKGRTSQQGSSSKRATSTSRLPSSGEPSEVRSSRLASSGGRLSTTNRIQPGTDPKSSFTRTPIMKGTRDDPIRSFEFLSIRK
ncbi:non-specific serine,threonine protein kinase [Sarracenia purpurea var. burkii]